MEMTEAESNSVPDPRNLAVASQPRVQLAVTESSSTGPQATAAAILRDRWRMIILVMLPLMTVSVGLIWWLVQPQYAISATVRVAAIVRPILFSDPETDITRNYRQYVQTEAADIKSTEVIDLALNRPEVRSLPLVVASQDKTAFILESLKVEPIQGTDLLKVSIIGEKPTETVTILNGVLDTYLSRRERKQREWDERILRSLRVEQNELEIKLKLKAQQLSWQDLDTKFGGTNDANVLVERLISEVNGELRQAKKALAVVTAKSSSLNPDSEMSDDSSLDPEGLEEYVSRDPEIGSLKQQLQTLELSALVDASAGRGPQHPDVQTRPALIASLKERISQRRAELRRVFVASHQQQLVFDLRAADATVHILEKEREELEQKKQGASGDRFVLEGLLHERDRLEQSLDQVRAKIWNVEVEEKRASRITIDSTARAPERPNLDKRPKYTAIAVLLSFLVGAGAALLQSRWDHRFRDAVEISHRLGVRVLGSVGYLDDENGPMKVFDNRLTDHIRGISTALLAVSPIHKTRARLITSPTPGSGKSSMALHIARSLAETGRNVLLVDADNHRQGISRRLQLIDRPGLVELLSGGHDAEQTVYACEIAHLNVLPAGMRVEHFGGLLSNRECQMRLHRLFTAYDDIIVDSSPVLLTSDAVLLATLVDEVVLVLRADRSTRDEAQAAQQYLAAVRSNVVGVVFNAVDRKRIGYGYGYTYAGDYA